MLPAISNEPNARQQLNYIGMRPAASMANDGLGLSHTALWFTENGPKNRKYQVSGGSVGEKTTVIVTQSDFYFELMGRQQ